MPAENFVAGFRTLGTGEQTVASYVWDTNTLTWVAATAATAGSGGAVTVTNWPSTQAVTGTFWQATQPVSLASLPALASGTNTIGSVKLTDGTSTATIGNLTNNKALATMIVDSSGNQITSFGGGTQYAAGTTQATPTGTVAMGKNSSNVLSALSLDSSGNLNVNVVAGGGSGGGNAAASATGAAVPASADYSGWNSGGNLVGTSLTTALPVQPGTGATFPVSGTFWQATQPVSAASLPLPSGAATEATLSAFNAKFAGLGQTTMAGSSPVVIASNQSAIPVTGTFWQATQPVSMATAPALVASSAIIGKVGIDQTTAGTTNAVSLAQIGATTVVTGGVNGTLAVGGVTAAAATATGNPVRVGAIARTTNPTAVTDGQVSNVMTDKVGRMVVVQGHARDLVGKQATTITSSTTATTIIGAQGASVFADITSLTVTNGSATATTVTLSDGTFSAVYNVPGGGGFVNTFSPPLPATAANVAWTLTCGTSVASIYVVAVFVRNT